MRTERVENALHFDISQGDDDVGMTQTTSSGVQAEAQTSSSGVQAEAQTSSPGVQVNVRPKTTSSGTQPTTRMEESETQTIRETKERGSQATEDRSEEIKQLRYASELEKQALIEQHVQNVERIRQQVMAEADTSHHRKKEEYKQEVLEQLQINEADAQRRIQQAQQQAQQEARQYVGSVVNYAEQALIYKLREEKSKTEQAEKRTKKQKHHNIILIRKMSEHQKIERRQNREPEVHQRKALANYRHFPLENQHLEVKINQNMITQNQSKNQKEKPGRPSNTKPTNQGPLKKIHRISQKQKQKQTQSQNQTQNMTLT